MLERLKAAARRRINAFSLAAVTFVVGMTLGGAISIWIEEDALEPNHRAAVSEPMPLAAKSGPVRAAAPKAAPLIPVEVAPLPPQAAEAEAAQPPIEHAPDFADLPGLPDPELPERMAVPETVAGEPAWKANAVELASLPEGPAIALVIDDVGLNRPGARRAIALPPPVTLAMMTYAEGLPALAASARRAGHELLVHMPMQPIDEAYDPGPNVLKTGLPDQELLGRIDWGLGRFEGYVGINNHMGSRFTTDADGMALLMTALKERGLMFLDSRTVRDSLGRAAAHGAEVPIASRDIFLDHERTPAFVSEQLQRLEEIALRRGYAVGIGHPHAVTLEALERWIPEARERGISFVPVTAIPKLRERRDLAARPAEAAGQGG